MTFSKMLHDFRFLRPPPAPTLNPVKACPGKTCGDLALPLPCPTKETVPEVQQGLTMDTKNDAIPRSCKSGRISWLGFLSGQRLCLRLPSPWLLLASQLGIRLIRSKGAKNHREWVSLGWHFCFEGAYIRSIGMVQLLFVFLFYSVWGILSDFLSGCFCLYFYFLLLCFSASSISGFFAFPLLFSSIFFFVFLLLRLSSTTCKTLRQLLKHQWTNQA